MLISHPTALTEAISVEEHRKEVLHVPSPVYKTPGSTPQSLLVVSTGTIVN